MARLTWLATLVRRLGFVLEFASSVLIALTIATYALARDGANALKMSLDNGWQAFELITQGDSLAGIGDAGYGTTLSRGSFDGLGPLRIGDTLAIAMNHEQTTAAISRIDVDLIALRQAADSKRGAAAFPVSIVSGVGYAYDAIYEGGYHAVTNPNPVAQGVAAVAAYGNANFYRLCSGSSHAPEAFGPGRGFVDSMYLTGEETFNASGKFYALDPLTRDLWEFAAAGGASWENAALVDTGETQHVALLVSSDYSSSPGDYLRLYVGTKGIDANSDGQIDFLERNGLRGGSVYYFIPDSGSTTNLPSGTVAGRWSSSTVGALRDTKIEDIGTNPLDGSQVAIGAQNDGVYVANLELDFSGGAFHPTTSTTSITQIRDSSVAPIGAPDNVTWSANGLIYVQEDGNGNELWHLTPSGADLTRFAISQSEPSGIVDISAWINYEPGGVLLGTAMGSGTSGAQLLVFVAPDATPLSATADFTADGRVDGDDFLAWQRGRAATGAAGLADGDANRDFVVDGADFALWQAEYGTGDGAVFRIPELPTATLAGLALALCAWRRRDV